MGRTPEEKRLLAAWPVPRRPGWVKHVKKPLTERGLEAIRRSVSRGNPYGDALWSKQTTERLGLATTVRPRGRPRKQRKGSWHLFRFPTEYMRARGLARLEGPIPPSTTLTPFVILDACHPQSARDWHDYSKYIHQTNVRGHVVVRNMYRNTGLSTISFATNDQSLT